MFPMNTTGALRNPLEQVVPQTTRHLRKSLEDVNVTLHEGRERIVVNSVGFFIRETRMERFSVTSRTISFWRAPRGDIWRQQ